MGLDADRMARIAATTERVRPFWEADHDPNRLQERLVELDCHGLDAFLVTKELMRCDTGEVQLAFFGAPCRDAERRFHNAFVDALEQEADAAEDQALDPDHR
ncbi:hypothetical protein SRB5_39670 [Streptomyces sp. RB5]|uniref:Uncharacterized protein n=1 Tax=Streptomyces smaragdinus TaxID=2585196 RepID=A0A7K0CLC4_9ACTN|nr:hypothetical protein [Streptomyces smaragdinus]MQY13812.1 hypothetical protein [Streptomyces smaragdinus]